LTGQSAVRNEGQPTIAAISAPPGDGDFELSLTCAHLRLAQDGEYRYRDTGIQYWAAPGAGRALKKMARTIGTAAALAHMLLGARLPQEAAQAGARESTVNGKAIDGALEIARRLVLLPKESLPTSSAGFATE